MPLSELERLYRRKEDFVNSRLNWLSKEIAKMQTDLMNLLFSDYTSKFDIKEGNIVMNTRNMRLIAKVDNVFNKFKEIGNVNTQFGEDMMKTTSYSADYYKGLDIKAKTVDSIAKQMGAIEQSIGISKGKITKGGYLDDLTKMAEVRIDIKDYVRNSVANSKGVTDYLKGFKDLVVGKPGIEGRLQRYYKQFAFDTFHQVDNAINKNFATNLNLKYFIYSPKTLIKTSRAFCRKRAGKVFSVAETKLWKNDPTLLGKSKAGYNPLIEMGRWRCRHKPRYITAELACQMGKKSACREIK